MNNDILKVRDLQKIYHTKKGEIKAIDNISFGVQDQEFVCIVGSSGCGKSTLLSILAGLEEKTFGDISWNMQNVRIGYMLQNDALFPWLTVLDNALLGLKIKKEDTKENKEYVISLLKTYGLGEFINKYPAELSGGMRQRVVCIQ